MGNKEATREIEKHVKECFKDWKTVETLTTTPTWIPVSESLPPVGQVVLAYTSYSEFVLSVRKMIPETNSVIWLDNEVTHWMPLPEAPK